MDRIRAYNINYLYYLLKIHFELYILLIAIHDMQIFITPALKRRVKFTEGKWLT